MTSNIEVNPGLDDSGLRRRSIGNIEMSDSHGRHVSVALEDLDRADRTLATEFGYKPVRKLQKRNANISNNLCCSI